MSNHRTRVAIIGHGTIGRPLHKRLIDERCQVVAVQKSKGLFEGSPDALTSLGDVNIGQATEDLDLAFIAIPTKADGEEALWTMMHFLERGIPVVTCEKGALANYFMTLERFIKAGRIGYSATVGGGSGIIDFVRNRRSDRTREVHVILNGTLNYIWTGLQEGIPEDRVVAEARLKGFADPGEEDPTRLILQEALRDAPMKAAILFNLGFAPQIPLKAKDFAMHLKEVALWRAIRTPGTWRFVVSYHNLAIPGPYSDLDNIIAFTAQHAGWSIIGGFKRVDDEPITRLCDPVRWEQNGALIIEGADGSGGTTLCIGDGAGPGPTTAAMLRDAERLLGPR